MVAVTGTSPKIANDSLKEASNIPPEAPRVTMLKSMLRLIGSVCGTYCPGRTISHIGKFIPSEFGSKASS